MKSKRKILISTLAVVLTAALAIGVFFFYKAFKKAHRPGRPNDSQHAGAH